MNQNEYTANCSYNTWEQICTCIDDRALSFMLINVRSFVGKFEEFEHYIQNFNRNITFIGIVETWLNENTDKLLELDGYRSSSIYRNKRKGGGIKLYYLDHIDVSIISEFTGIEEFCETLSVKATIPGYGCIYVSCCYRPPSGAMQDFLTHMETVLERITYHKCVFMGDFNINVSSAGGAIDEYTNLLESYGLVNEVNLPTYVAPTTFEEKSVLDHIWHNLIIDRKTYVVRPALSDHYAVIVCFQNHINNKELKIKFRDFSENNIDIFVNSMQGEFSSCNPPYSNSDVCAEYIGDFLMKLLNKYFPIKTKQVTSKRILTPWMDRNVLKCVDKKHRWYRLWKAGEIATELYKRYCTELRKLLRMAKEDYYRGKLSSLGNNPRKNWKIMNSLLGRKNMQLSDSFVIDGTSTCDKDTITNAFNNYFVSHPIALHAAVPPPLNGYLNLIPIQANSMYFHHCTEREVFINISKLKSEGNIEDISSRFLKLCGNYVSGILSGLFNLSIDSCVYPSSFKVARISPIYKKNSRCEIQNHRPISTLSNCAKVFDGIIYDRLEKYFNVHGLLCDSQFGFRKDKNTEMACISLIDKILPVFDRGLYCIAVFLDFSSCFDTISRDILFRKLERYGVRGISLEFIKSYFSSRSQYVQLGDVKSLLLKQDLGTIQGSKNGPIFFDIYSNDVNYLLSDNACVLYADDTSLIYVGSDLTELVKYVNTKLGELLDWCNYNKLVLNPVKSEFMLLTNKKIEAAPVVHLGGNPITMVKTVKYLGMYLDSKLKYDNQIANVKTKLARYAGVTYRLKNYFNFHSAKNLYYSCIYSILSYCIVVWGGVFTCTQKGIALQRLQNKIVKNLFSVHFHNSGCMYKQVRLLKLVDIYRFYISMYMYKIVRDNKYQTLKTNLNLQLPSHFHNTRQKNDLILPFPRVENIRLSFKYQFVGIWNDLPTRLKDISTLSVFKKNLFEYLLSKY